LQTLVQRRFVVSTTIDLLTDAVGGVINENCRHPVIVIKGRNKRATRNKIQRKEKTRKEHFVKLCWNSLEPQKKNGGPLESAFVIATRLALLKARSRRFVLVEKCRNRATFATLFLPIDKRSGIWKRAKRKSITDLSGVLSRPENAKKMHVRPSNSRPDEPPLSRGIV
jgi:hypothetical protein